MKRLLILILIMLCAGIILNAGATEKELSSAQQELWKMEEAYWFNYKNGDIEGITTFYHADFAGWPSSSRKPIYLTSAKSYLEKLLEVWIVKSYKLQPYAIVIHGKIAIIHYLVEIKSESQDGNISVSTHRITHTWVNEGNKWKIIGGMSAD